MTGLPAAASAAAVFITTNDVLRIYDKSFHQIAERAFGFRIGVKTDRLANLYVVSDATAYVYKPPYTGTPLALTIGVRNSKVTGIAVDERTGLVALAWLQHSYGPYLGGTTFFRTGESKPCKNVPGDATEVSFDARGTLFYTATDDPSAPSVLGTISGGCAATKQEPLVSPVQFPYNIIVDANDDIALGDGKTVKTYAHPINGTFSAPVSTTAVSPYCQMMALTGDGRHIWEYCVVESHPLRTHLAEFAYPQSGHVERVVSISEAHDQSIAVLPPIVP